MERVQILTAVAQNLTAVAQVLTAFFGDVNHAHAATFGRAHVIHTDNYIATRITTLWSVSYALPHCYHNRESTVENG